MVSPSRPPYPAPPPNAPSPFDLGGPPRGERASSPIGPTCRSCQKVLTDPFDQALGTCDECRGREASVPVPAGEVATRVERVGVSDLHTRVPASEERAPVTPVPKARPAAEPVFGAPLSVKAEPTSVRSAARKRAWPAPVRAIGLLLGVALVVGVGVYAVTRRPWVKKAPLLAVRREGASTKKVEAIVQQWKLNYPELVGEPPKRARDFVAQGEALLARDTTAAYREAEEFFRKALVLDASEDRAAAGWVLALAFGRGAELDEVTSKAAESMLIAAEQHGGEPRVYVAHAHLLLARQGNPNDVQVLAERGRSSSSATDKALAALALGQTLLVKNPQQAAAAFREALALDPSLKRAYLAQSRLAASLGKYKEAIEGLERRLALDRDQWEAAETLARLYVDVGELSKAKKVLEGAAGVAPSAGRPRLALAALEYQHLGEFSEASAALEALTAAAELPASERAEAWLHLGILRRLSGELEAAGTALDKALELRPELTAARLQKFLVAVDRGIVSAARLELDALKGKLEDTALEATLEGRLLIAEHRLDEAVTTLVEVADKEVRRVDALLLAGAAAAQARQDGKAWELCLKRGLKADPHSRPVAPITTLYVRPADLLKVAVGAYAKLSPSPEDPNPALCEGLVAWYSEDLPAAERAFSRVTSIDPRGADGYAFRSLIAASRRDFGAAARLAAKGIDANKTNALAYAAQGLVDLQSNRADAAKAAATNALKHNPGLLLGKTVLGDASARLSEPEEARRILTTVLLSDPLYRDAKRVLYKQQL